MQLNHIESDVARRLGDLRSGRGSKDSHAPGARRHSTEDRACRRNIHTSRTVREDNAKKACAKRRA